MAARSLPALVAAAALLLASCGGGGGGGGEPDANGQIEDAVRAVFGAAPLVVQDGFTRAQFVTSRDAFCNALVVHSGNPSELERTQIPPRPTGEKGVEAGANDKVVGSARVTSIGPIEITAIARPWSFLPAEVPDDPKPQPSAALLLRREGRWRVVLPCAVIGCRRDAAQ